MRRVLLLLCLQSAPRLHCSFDVHLLVVASHFVPLKVAARIAAGAGNEGLAIRGASKATTAVGRLRRNAISLNGDNTARTAPVGTKIIDLWREFVKQRWNPEARFLNLEVSAFVASICFSYNNQTSCSACSTTTSSSRIRWLLQGPLEPLQRRLLSYSNSPDS